MAKGKMSVLLLIVALFVGAAAPYASAAFVFPCVSLSDCPVMADLCDMAGMTSHDSCCHPSLASDDSALPAVVKASLTLGPAHTAQGPAPAVLSQAPRPSLLVPQDAVALSPPGSPPVVSVLRI